MKTVRLDFEGSRRLTGFPADDSSGVLIDFGENTSNMAGVTRLVWALPDDYKLHIVSAPIEEVLPSISESLSGYTNGHEANAFLNELDVAIQLFEKITSERNPFVSLRIVTEEYLQQEHPSVSRHYHRDAATLTLTKCFSGEGAIYLDNDNVKRSYFDIESIASHDEYAAHDPEKFNVVPPGHWLLLKGEIYPGIDERNGSLFRFMLGEEVVFGNYNRGNGLIHKGGRLAPGDRRLVFNINTYRWQF
jgi:hypothetical protein